MFIITSLLLGSNSEIFSRNFHEPDIDRLKVMCDALQDLQTLNDSGVSPTMHLEVEQAVERIERRRRNFNFEAEVRAEMAKGKESLEFFLNELSDEAFFNSGNYPGITAYCRLVHRGRRRTRPLD